MTKDLLYHLKDLAEQGQNNHIEDLYLWPRTPIGNLQAEAWQRVGVSDWREDDPASRPAQIIIALKQLLYNELLEDRFSVLDICCGDAVILWHIKRQFPRATVCGVDLRAGLFEHNKMAHDMGVRLFAVPIQRLFKAEQDMPFDVAIMLNTYRGWDAAQLKPDELWLPDAADRWFRNNARFTILTVAEHQIDELKDNGFWVATIGKGEDDSKMILMFPCDKELGLWSQTRRS